MATPSRLLRIVPPTAGEVAEIGQAYSDHRGRSVTWLDNMLEFGIGAGREGDWEISVYLPKFIIETGTLLLNDRLAALGVPFGSGDYSGFGFDAAPLTNLVHSVVIGVDEAGLEAAAATGGEGAHSGPVFVLDVNRPFIYLVRDQPTGIVLVCGRVLDPVP